MRCEFRQITFLACLRLSAMPPSPRACQPMLSLLNIKQCLLAFKCHASSPRVSIHPQKRKFWSQPVTLLCRGRAHAVLVYLAFDSIKIQHVTSTCDLPHTSNHIPMLHSCLFLASNPNKCKITSVSPGLACQSLPSPKKARQGGQIQIWQSSFHSFEVLKYQILVLLAYY